MEINIDKNIKQQAIPPIVLQVLLENVIKHNKLTTTNPTSPSQILISKARVVLFRNWLEQ